MNLFVDDIQFLILMNFVDIKIKSSNQNKRINKISVNNWRIIYNLVLYIYIVNTTSRKFRISIQTLMLYR